MSLDRSASNSSLAALAAIALKVVGWTTILSALVDYLILLVPLNLGNPQWQVAVTTQMIDRGILPLVGIALSLTSLWIESSLRTTPLPRASRSDLPFWLSVLASVFGALYLALTVLHLSGVQFSSQSALQQVGTEASQASSQLEQRISSQLSQQQSQLEALLKNPERLDQAIQSGQLPKEIQQYRNNPEGLKKFLQDQADQARKKYQAEIGNRRIEAERRVRQESWKNGIRTAVTSVLLTLGYSLLGWQGLRQTSRG
jgi:hypothetical protein